ncbi:glutathione S-transferase-like [Impatiens glandulifera]|uniref:glutathione S-transferase-like n=1 Tax=Impatiens glandulifera TaxID=253017 RepID=UPI001FB0BE29|nr:glutathione S-transferase-like [Impatiens glandulifera]
MAGLEVVSGRKLLYGSLDSKETMRVFATFFEHEIDFEFINVNIKPEDHRDFLSQIPFGELPVYKEEEGDLIVFGSRAIMRYLSHMYMTTGKEFIYVSPRMQVIVSSWIESEDHWFDPLASKLIEKSKNGLAQTEEEAEAAVAETEKELAKILDVYEDQLKVNDYLAGDKFTTADLTHLPNLYYLMKMKTKRLFEERPRVAAWCAVIMPRPAWAKVVAMVET